MPADVGGNRDAAPMHVVMLPWLAFGHIVPFVQLARRLLASSSSSVRVTFLTAAGNVPRVEAMLSSASSAGEVAVVPLRLPHVPGLPEDAASTADVSLDGAELLKVALDGARPQVAALLAELRPDAVLLDFATPWATEDAAALGVKSFHFCVFSAVANAYLAVPARCPDGAVVAQPSVRDLMSAPSGFPGSSPLATAGVPAYQAADFTYVYTSFGGQPCAYDREAAVKRSCDGIVLKTCFEMEGAYINYLATQLRKPVLLAGPLVPDPPRGELDERWATWLSAFPDGAVVFASFGSETFLTPAAATELLLGLEATGLPFLAVLNSPDGEAVVLPPGFTERVSGRGLVHTGWVQQQHILRHRSVGCYVTHAGFSSVVEGLIAGCRLVLLPMKTDQFLNAALFARDLRVGVEVARRDEDGWFGRQDVCDAVAAAVADGGEGNASKWAEFLTDDAVQGRFTDEFVRQLRELVSATASS